MRWKGTGVGFNPSQESSWNVRPRHKSIACPGPVALGLESGGDTRQLVLSPGTKDPRCLSTELGGCDSRGYRVRAELLACPGDGSIPQFPPIIDRHPARILPPRMAVEE